MKIIIWTGPAWETWGSASLTTGIGGSEAAAVYMSRELATLGHEVEVVGQVTPSATLYPGAGTVRFVDHREYAEYSPFSSSQPPVRTGRRMECDVFVSSRYLTALGSCQPDARLKVLWSHDVHFGPDPHKIMSDYDHVLCLSRWALDLVRRFYPHVPAERFVQTRNGIPTELYQPGPVKEGFRVVYSSSADRGLDRLLDYWPAIRKMRPDAELCVYYGFDTWEKMAARNHDYVAAAQIQIFRARISALADQGVTLRGRVGQAELARAWLGARAWLYPTNFCETSCITAMEAQAAGALCVCTRLAALEETAKYAYLVDPPSDRQGYREEFLVHAESITRNFGGCGQVSDWQAERSAEGREWALRELGWGGVAQQWDELFRSRLGLKGDHGTDR